MRYENLTGRRFNRLIALEYAGTRGPTQTMWLCLCDCGVRKVINAQALKKGATQSCGCLNAERRAETHTKHGLSHHPLYGTWKGIMGRCYNPKDKDYPSYGGRGIAVCERWHKVENFVADLVAAPEGKTLDRRNNLLGYSPRNVRWASAQQQGNNKRNNVSGLVNGEKMCVAKAAREFGVTETTIFRRMSAGMTLEQAVAVPTRKYQRK